MQPRVEIYTWSSCPFCLRAKALLDRKGVAYEELVRAGDDPARQSMSEGADGRRSVPQTVINDRGSGGSDGIYALESSGRLGPLLTGA